MANSVDIASKLDFKAGLTDADVDKAWADAKSYLGKLDLSTTSKADAKKILAAMNASKKPLTFVASFDKDDWIKVTAVVGGKVIETETEASISEGGDQKKARARLQKMASGGKLFTTSDLANWDKKHPDPDRVDKLKAERRKLNNDIKQIQTQIRRLLEEAKPLQTQLIGKEVEGKALDEQMKALGMDPKKV